MIEERAAVTGKLFEFLRKGAYHSPEFIGGQILVEQHLGRGGNFDSRRDGQHHRTEEVRAFPLPLFLGRKSHFRQQRSGLIVGFNVWDKAI